jgi:hypothetical protein
MYNMLNALNVQTSGSNIRGEKQTPGISLKPKKILRRYKEAYWTVLPHSVRAESRLQEL